MKTGTSQHLLLPLQSLLPCSFYGLLLPNLMKTIPKAEHWRTDAFELWCWRRHLRAPWTARRSNQSILKEINPEYSLEGLMLKLKLQYFDHMMWRVDSLEKTLMLGEIEGKRRGQQRMRWLDGITNSMDIYVYVCQSHSVVSESLQPHELYSPWNSPGQNTGAASCSLLQGIFPTQGSNPGLPHCRRVLYQLSHREVQEYWSR